MGISLSSRRRNNNYLQNPPPSQLISSYPSDPSPLPPPQNFIFAANPPYPSPPYPSHNPYSTPPPPPPPPPPPQPPHPHCYQYSGGYNSSGYLGSTMGRSNSNYLPYYANQSNGWSGIRPSMIQPRPPPPPYVDHQTAKKIRNDVNVHKNTIKVEVDENNPDHYLVSFTFDALVDGSITIFYFAKEGDNCRFTPLYPEAHMPVGVPFQKGLGQKFCQPSGTGIDLGFFVLDDLSKPSPKEDVFPLVIFAESCLPPLPTEEQLGLPRPSTSHAQITQAILEKKNGDPFQVKVIKQILWVDEVRYELRDIYGIGSSAEAGFDDNEPGKMCVICMSEPKDTAVLPCRHMCICSECAKELRLQTNKCPICRQPIEELLEIKVNKSAQ